MSDGPNTSHREFHTAICEVEPGVFRAEHRGKLDPTDPDERELPDFHLGTSLADVKIWVEQMARSMAYDRVVWDASPH
jgi:hypothetical protein